MKFCVEPQDVFTPVSLTITFENALELKQLIRIMSSNNDKLNKLIDSDEYELITSANDKWVDDFAAELCNISNGEYPID